MGLVCWLLSVQKRMGVWIYGGVSARNPGFLVSLMLACVVDVGLLCGPSDYWIDWTTTRVYRNNNRIVRYYIQSRKLTEQDLEGMERRVMDGRVREVLYSWLYTGKFRPISCLEIAYGAFVGVLSYLRVSSCSVRPVF